MLLLACLSLVAWLVVLLHRAPPRHLLPDGDAAAGAEPARWPPVAIIVPARNEADSLPLTLPLLLAQDYPGPLRVIVVDERSSDGTGDVARAVTGDVTRAVTRERAEIVPRERAEIVTGQPLPAGWAGKVWGMQQGLEHAGVLGGTGPEHEHEHGHEHGHGPGPRPEYVLFTDADIAHEPGSLRRLVAESERDALDLDSRMALLRCESPAEKLLIPAFLFFFATLYPMRRVNASDSPSRLAASAGGCQLVRASALRAMGGVEPMASRLIDDVSLARELLARGGRLRLACSRGEVRSLRAYPGIGDVWRMVRRSAFEELRHSWLRLLACLAALGLVFIVPFAAMLSGGLAAMMGLLAWLASAAAFLPAVTHFRLSPLRALTLPFAGLLYAGMTLDSALRFARMRPDGWRSETGARNASPA